jgi:EF-P beta-lysylation protein EpmB
MLAPPWNQSDPMQFDWQTELAQSYRNPTELLAALELTPDQVSLPTEPVGGFPFRVTRAYASRMKMRDPRDPLLLQVLTQSAELDTVPGFNTDPVGDLQALTTPGLLHKYAGRALLISTGACAIHCRYCFRRNFPYDTQQLARSRESAALAAIADDPSVHEVILSGGDPLVLADDRLTELISAIAAIPHVRRLRIHSRLPVVLPSRIHPGLLELLSASGLQIVLVIHANHPNEIDASVRQGLLRVKQHGFTVLNQAVLLKDINDNAEILVALSEALFEAGALPYYLHLLDKAQGTAHFDVDEVAARSMMAAVRGQLPGYLVPRLVREVAGQPYKLPIT